MAQDVVEQFQELELRWAREFKKVLDTTAINTTREARVLALRKANVIANRYGHPEYADLIYCCLKCRLFDEPMPAQRVKIPASELPRLLAIEKCGKNVEDANGRS